MACCCFCWCCLCCCYCVVVVVVLLVADFDVSFRCCFKKKIDLRSSATYSEYQVLRSTNSTVSVVLLRYMCSWLPATGTRTHEYDLCRDVLHYLLGISSARTYVIPGTMFCTPNGLRYLQESLPDYRTTGTNRKRRKLERREKNSGDWDAKFDFREETNGKKISRDSKMVS